MKKTLIVVPFVILLSMLPTYAAVAPEKEWMERLKENKTLYRIAKCESSLNPKAYSHDGGAQARGLFQITRKYHPEVSDQQAFDPKWSL